MITTTAKTDKPEATMTIRAAILLTGLTEYQPSELMLDGSIGLVFTGSSTRLLSRDVERIAAERKGGRK